MAIFIIFENPGTYAPLRLSKLPIILGRSSKSGLQLKDGMCSAQHMSLQLSPDGHVIVSDLNSTNGTYINETLISMASKLFVGDIVRIGDTKLFIDESSLTPKELNTLTSTSNRTSFTSLDLPKDSSEDTFKAAKLARRKAMGLPKELDDNPEPAVIKLDSSFSQIGIKKTNKENKKLSIVHNRDSDEALFDLGESSGQTKMIKIEKKKAVTKIAKTRDRTTSHTPHSKKERPSGFFSKIISLFNKDD